MTLNLNQITELINIINRFHVVFIAKNLGTTMLSKEDKEALKKAGVDVDKLSKTGKLDDSFNFGILADAIKDKRAKTLSYNEFKKFISSGKFVPLTKVETLALNNVKLQAYGDIKGLGNKISKDLHQIIVDTDRKNREKHEKIIEKEIEGMFLDRKTLKEVSSAIGHKTKDWSRDFDRIVDFVSHNAFDMGKAQSLMSRLGNDAKAYKEVYKGACKHCIRLYLTNGEGSAPKIFKVSELVANGTNIGKKVDEWKPVVGSTHPWCRCEFIELPENTEWDVKKQSFELVRNTYGVKRTSRAKVTITTT